MTATARWISIVLFVLVGVGQPVRLGLSAEPAAPDPNDPTLVGPGKVVYDEQCARCHGAKLEGQPDWRHRLPNGRMPAPPHDPTGHTWHHSDKQLFDMTKLGPDALVPGYQSDMPDTRTSSATPTLGRALIHREHVADRHPRETAANG